MDLAKVGEWEGLPGIISDRDNFKVCTLGMMFFTKKYTKKSIYKKLPTI